jgi:hypothetical protein
MSLSPAATSFVTAPSLRVFFAHQSVGDNILDGIAAVARAINAGDQATLTIESVDSGTIRSATILDAHVGQNNLPVTKISEFESLLAAGAAEQVDVALLKFCFVDIREERSVNDLFREYVSAIERLESEYPGITFVYATVPLTGPRRDLKGLVRRVLQMDRQVISENAPRFAFNQMLREAKADTGRLFDVARVEATRPDGTVYHVTVDGQEYEAMYPAYTNDGGHLNETGRLVVARELLEFLANLSGSE